MLSKSAATPKYNPRASTTSDPEEILERLSANEKNLLSVPTTVPLRALTYEESACVALPHVSHERPVPGQALGEVTVKIISDPQQR
jgi:hypothetical protein